MTRHEPQLSKTVSNKRKVSGRRSRGFTALYQNPLIGITRRLLETSRAPCTSQVYIEKCSRDPLRAFETLRFRVLRSRRHPLGPRRFRRRSNLDYSAFSVVRCRCGLPHKIKNFSTSIDRTAPFLLLCRYEVHSPKLVLCVRFPQARRTSRENQCSMERSTTRRDRSQSPCMRCLCEVSIFHTSVPPTSGIH
jgi:hypothetical protein